MRERAPLAALQRYLIERGHARHTVYAYLDRAAHPQSFFEGYRVAGIDGSQSSLSNTAAIVEALPKAACRRFKAAFAKLRLLTVALRGPLDAASGAERLRRARYRLSGSHRENIATALIARFRVEAATSASVPPTRVSFYKLMTEVESLWSAERILGETLTRTQRERMLSKFYENVRRWTLLSERRPRSCQSILRYRH